VGMAKECAKGKIRFFENNYICLTHRNSKERAKNSIIIFLILKKIIQRYYTGMQASLCN